MGGGGGVLGGGSSASTRRSSSITSIKQLRPLLLGQPPPEPCGCALTPELSSELLKNMKGTIRHEKNRTMDIEQATRTTAAYNATPP